MSDTIVSMPLRRAANFYREMGARLKVARGFRSPAQVALALGVETREYESWEAGVAQAPLDIIQRFCAATLSSPNFIVTGVPDGEWHGGTETGVFLKRDPQQTYRSLSSALSELEDLLDEVPYDALGETSHEDAEALSTAHEYVLAAEQCLRKIVE